MALELVATGRRQATLREYDPEPPGPGEVRIDSSVSAFKHGTGLRGFRADTRDYTAPFDWELRLHREGATEPPDYPLALGNMTVGTVAEAGADVAVDAGDRVYGHLPIRETHTVGADRINPVPGGMSAGAVACSDPGRVGVHLVRVAGIGVGDAVRATAFGGTVAACGYYADDPAGLRLEGEWHRNALDLRSVRPPSEPLREHPRWTLDRLDDTAFDLLAAGRLSADGLLDPVVPLERAVEGLELIDERPEESVKLGVRYD